MPFFWLHVAVGLVIWYLLSISFARALFLRRGEPYEAAQTGTRLALLIGMILIAGYALWASSEQLTFAVAAAVAVFTIASLILAFIRQREPDGART
jgi:hypothetical protein